ncbi:cytochrome c4 [Pseudomonas aeruginosa]|nr:cytochrome c4 [Pseudomonas aeruginosa]
MPVAHRLLFSLTALLAATAQAAVDGQKLYTQGGANPAAAACVTCHGADGMGLAAAGFPRLAGLPAAYLSKQLHDLKQGGSREHPVMKGIADALGDDEIQALATTLAAMPAPKLVELSRVATPRSPGETLAVRGAWERNIPECVTCHGPAGIGVGEAFPPLQGQGEMYLSNQLRAWQLGTRRNDPNDLMGHIAKSLSEEEIRSVSQFFATLGQAGGQP